jgi:hypothetical protein
MKTFISHDGVDANGVRAQVYVQDGDGVIKEIKESVNGTADVHFTVENLKFPVHGWIGQDNPVYELVKKAKESGEKVTFRIESQRKSKVDRSLPMEDLRKDMNSARENTIAILASVNGVVSDEAVTNPDEDPNQTFGRIKATGGEPKKSAAGVLIAGTALEVLKTASADQTVTNDIISSLAASALLAGAEVSEVQAAISGPDRRDDSQPELRKNFSVEAPSWKAYNSDGRQNLGASNIQAGVGVEQFTRLQLSRVAGNEDVASPEFNDAVTYFARLTLAIADKVQSAGYGKGFRADRSVASHARVRGIVYDTISEYYPLPVNPELHATQEDVDAWVTNVGRLSFNRFKLAIEITNDNALIEQITAPASLITGGSKPVVKAEVSPEVVVEAVVEPVVVETVVEEVVEPVVEAKKGSKKAPAVKDEPAVAETVEAVVEAPVASTETVVETVSEAVATDYEALPQTLLDESLLVDGKLSSDVAATEETIEEFKAFVAEAGLESRDELVKVSKLLAWTFGEKFAKASNIPDEELVNFIDFYVASGTDNFVKTVNGVAK